MVVILQPEHSVYTLWYTVLVWKYTIPLSFLNKLKNKKKGYMIQDINSSKECYRFLA